MNKQKKSDYKLNGRHYCKWLLQVGKMDKERQKGTMSTTPETKVNLIQVETENKYSYLLTKTEYVRISRKDKVIIPAKNPVRCKLIIQVKPIEQLMQIAYIRRNKYIKSLESGERSYAPN